MPGITLTYDSTPCVLHPDMQWSEEHSWQAVIQTAQRSITGALIVQTGQMLLGQPITLHPPDESSAWMSGATLAVLRSWANVAGRVMSLSIGGVTKNVMFRHQDGPGVEAVPVVFYRADDVETTDFYLVTIRLQEIE
jgi:hypothetical protein